MAEDSLKRPVRILMLEDNAVDAELAVARLRKANLAPEVVLAHDRQSFMQALLARAYDLILADYAVPGFDGVTALQLARENRPDTPFIFLSGPVGEEVAIDTLQRGAIDYVLKNRLERLAPAVIRALNEAEEHAIRIEAEAMFRQSELRFRHLIDAVSQMVWVATPDGALTYHNQAWSDCVADGTPRWCEPELFHPDDYPGCMAAWHTALEQIEPFSAEVRLLSRTEGKYRWHLLRVTPMQPDPEGSGTQQVQWLGTATDLQDQKLNEEALRVAEKLSVTGRLAASIAHEINNPLESLTNLLYLVRLESAGNQRAISFLDMTENELARISSITKQTLQFYRDPSVPVDIDARDILQEVLRLFATRFTSKGIATTLQAPQGLLFQAIQGEIRQVLINLVTNAIDAVQPKGSIAIEARRVERAGQPAVEILVQDDGSGILPDQRPHLFQPFFSTKGAHGTGLGLWVSRGIVEKHGGTLRLASSSVDGASQTTASVVLPIQPAAELKPEANDGTRH